jgi:hypothetical protein
MYLTMALWYVHGQTDDGDVVHDASELDGALDRVAALSSENWAALATMTRINEPIKSVLYVGIHGDLGALLYASVDDGREFSRGQGSSDGEPLLYMYMTSADEFPSNAEISVEVVRRAAHEFAETGQRPTCLEWQTWDRVLDDTESDWPDWQPPEGDI